MPTSDFVRDAAVAGVLMSYGTSVPEVFRQAAIYSGSILKGAKPADLPVLQSTKFEFILNLQTARSNCTFSWHRYPSDVASLRRRGDRITVTFAAVHMSAFGTKRTSRPC